MPSTKKKFEELTGRSHRADLIPWENNSKILVHEKILPDLINLKNELKAHGINLGLVSGYRSYDQQLKIWNEKALGLRKIYDDHHQEVIITKLSPEEILNAILRFSAIPGLSRHHFGSDMDIYDQNIKESKLVQLSVMETMTDFHLLNHHINELLNNSDNFGNVFFRPYQNNVGKISEEPWHLSHTITSKKYTDQYDIKVFNQNIQESDMELKELILKQPEYYFYHYFKIYCH